MSAAVEVRGLAKIYGRQRALHGLDFALEAGTFTLIAGPNGAGKSTLLRVLAALTRPSRGEVRVLDGDPFGRGSGELRRRIGYLGAQPGLYDGLTLQENLELAGRLRGVEPHRVSALIAELELASVARRSFGELSLGYRRRAGLARALLGAPDLLLLDEPWSGLDAASVRRLNLQLARRHEQGATVLVAAHAVRDLLPLCDAVLSLADGQLRALEPPRDAHAETY